MTLSKGVLEIIAMANGSPKTFSDFTRINIGKRRLSSATVSKRLKELVAARILEEVVVKSKTGRRVIAYRSTDRGRKVYGLAREFEKALKDVKR